MQTLGGSPPRIQAAMFSTMWNRWSTTHRYQQKASDCLLGCGFEGGDRIEHYCRCGIVKDLCRKRLNINPDMFANLHSFTLTSPHIRTRSILCMVGLLNYATYKAVNNIRHRNKGVPCSADVGRDALAQAVREGAMGHQFAIKSLRERWNDTSDEEFPPAPVVAFTGQCKRFRLLGLEQARNVKRRSV